MTAKIIPFTPAEYNRDDTDSYNRLRLGMAWHIIHAKPGIFETIRVIEACHFLEAKGNWCEVERGREVRRALTAEIGEPTPRSKVSLDGLFAMAMIALTVGLLLGAISTRFM